MKSLLILPTYNEAQNIPRLLDEVLKLNEQRQLQLDILIIDDNSPDGTGGIVEESAKKQPTLHLLHRPGKMGLGSAYRTGFQYAIDHGYDAVIQMDADFSHNPNDLTEFVKWLKDYDLVIGARYIPGGSISNWNFMRRTLSRCANLYSRIVLGTAIHDMTGGFNGYRTSALKALSYDKVNTNGYAFQIEMKYRASIKKLKFKEFPITFIDRKYGVSKIPRTEVPTALLRVLRWRFKKFDF
jgi:dolichol-phosphate mannosyltransferase